MRFSNPEEKLDLMFFCRDALNQSTVMFILYIYPTSYLSGVINVSRENRASPADSSSVSLSTSFTFRES